jgi:DNA modification methylase
MTHQIGDCTLYTGDVLSVLATMPDESVHCVVTSPPYWGLRDYGTGTWEGGSAECDHRHQLGGEGATSAKQNTSAGTQSIAYAGTCPRCGARRIDQQIGLEETPEQYVAKMVAVFREVRRVLRADGTAWVNLGSSYAGSGRGPTGENGIQKAEERQGFTGAPRKPSSTEGENVPAGWTNRNSDLRSPSVYGFKPKDMIPIPWMVAMALQADGWYLRSDIIWAKPNPMPESMTDRPTKAHEYLFLLAKSAKYFYDAEAIRERAEPRDDERPFGNAGGNRHGDEGRTYKSKKPDGWDTGAGGHGTVHRDGCERGEVSEIRYGRNRRTVWTIATEPYPEAHFATFPRKLVQPCILAGCPEHACPKCGAPWEREVERETSGRVDHDGPDDGPRDAGIWGGQRGESSARTVGEHPTCDCGLPPIGGTVLDPFGGSGTTAEVALEYGRRAILIELKPEYVEMAKRRLAPVAGRPMLDFVGGGNE